MAVKTEEAPIEQRKVSELIVAGYSLDLILKQVPEEKSVKGELKPVNQYYLYVKYKSVVRPIFTQRNEHRCFISVERAMDWGKRLGFSSASLSLNFDDFVLTE